VRNPTTSSICGKAQTCRSLQYKHLDALAQQSLIFLKKYIATLIDILFWRSILGW
jgi:hypothetical protein